MAKTKSKRFYIFLPDDDHRVVELDTSEEVQAFLLEHGHTAYHHPETVWVIFGERFGFVADVEPKRFRLKGPE